MEHLVWDISNLLTFPDLLKSSRLPVVAMKSKVHTKPAHVCQVGDQEGVWVSDDLETDGSPVGG